MTPVLNLSYAKGCGKLNPLGLEATPLKAVESPSHCQYEGLPLSQWV